MIIWRGWGALPIAIAAVCIGLGVAMSSANPGLRSVFVGLMLIGGGVGTWFLGQWFNKTRPVAEFDSWFAKRREEVGHLVRGGAYANVPDPQRPGQLADPWAVGEYVLQQEAAKVKGALSNRHTLFFVPMQFIAPVLAVGGLAAMVSGVFN